MTTAQTQVAPDPVVQSPPPIAEWGMVLTFTIAGATWLGKNLWAYFSNKEAAESSLLTTLITNLQHSQEQLLRDNKESQNELVRQIALKESLVLTQQDVNRALSSQAGLYTQAVSTLTRVEAKLDALHRRLDDQEKIQ